MRLSFLSARNDFRVPRATHGGRVFVQGTLTPLEADSGSALGYVPDACLVPNRLDPIGGRNAVAIYGLECDLEMVGLLHAQAASA